MEIKTPYGDVIIPLHSGNIGISSSGGVDSTILLYLLASVNVYPRVFFLENAHSNYQALSNCVDFINEKTGSALVIEKITRISEGHFLRPDIAMLCGMVDYLYTGVTKNPPVTVSEHGLPPNRPTQKFIKIIAPFQFLDKRSSTYLYKLYNVQELFDLTYTCTQHETIPCNECFACCEKNWAIKEVGAE